MDGKRPDEHQAGEEPQPVAPGSEAVGKKPKVTSANRSRAWVDIRNSSVPATTLSTLTRQATNMRYAQGA